MCRATLEGVAFAFAYGMEIMKKDGLEAKLIRAGNDNLFQSEIFSSTLSTIINQPIEIYDTTGAFGAARAAGGAVRGRQPGAGDPRRLRVRRRAQHR